jgi:NDP-sugar pyrophosphorylase family protein
MRAVIMAGGRGLRLHPLTKSTCKPMLHVKHKPILQTIVEGMADQGISKITMVVNYKRDLIQGYFQSGEKFGIEIEYLIEDEPMGTAGSLRSIDMECPFIVSNADVISDIDYFHMVDHHYRYNTPKITIAAALHQQQIRFGVIERKENLLSSIQEKPICSWEVNAGVYIVDPECISLIPPHQRFDMTELIGACLKRDPESVGVYTLNGYWVDIGTFEDLSSANTCT